MRSNQTIKGYKLVSGTEYNIQDEFNAPIVAIQNQSGVSANVILNNGEPMVFTAEPFAWEPYIPLLGVIQTDGSDVVVFA
tara:strand:- start:15332 stop:15571 length:240 start_codon:yes stop_codon:yes gene_type:complete